MGHSKRQHATHAWWNAYVEHTEWNRGLSTLAVSAVLVRAGSGGSGSSSLRGACRWRAVGPGRGTYS